MFDKKYLLVISLLNFFQATIRILLVVQLIDEPIQTPYIVRLMVLTPMMLLDIHSIELKQASSILLFVLAKMIQSTVQINIYFVE